MCKKGSISQSKMEEAVQAADSAASVATHAIDNIDKTADKVLDSASIKIKDFENTKKRHSTENRKYFKDR